MEVEKNIEIPRRHKNTKYPWAELKVGNSFFVADKKKKHVMFSCVAAFNKGKKKKDQITITLREEGEGIRVWRIK